MQSTSLPPATKAEKRRFSAILDLGCVACRSDNHESLYPVEVHHLLDGGVRRGHAESIACCSWHHRGVAPGGLTQKMATESFGPSLALDGRGFRNRYGGDNALLAFQNFLLTLPDVQ